MPPHERLGSDDMKHLEDGWKQSIELDEDPPIEVGQTNPAPALAAQHEQLVPQDRILGLKPRVRSTRRDQDGQNRPEEARSSDQLTPFALLLNGMRFSVQTGVTENEVASSGDRHAVAREHPPKSRGVRDVELGSLGERHVSR